MANASGGLETFGRNVRLATADMSPEAIKTALAQFAKDELRASLASGEASATYERYVNGVRGAREESVIPPGPIVYVFAYWSLIVRAALDELRRRVPVRSGRYAGGFVVLANGRPVQAYADIPLDAEVIIFNARPYTRKMEVGGNRTGAKHFDGAGRAVNRQFKGTAVCNISFLSVQGGLHAGVPYILKGTARSSSRKVRRDRQPGQPITYPALVINMVQ
jgi:hypothetical protein